MKLDKKALAKYPDILSKEQFRIVGHMSKRTASYLLESMILPSRHTNKKTRCYFIKKKDIIELFDDMEKNPQKYAAPPKWYSENTKMKVSPYMLRYTPFDPVNTNKLRAYYVKELEPYDNILSVMQVATFTGYKSTTVTSWIRTGRMEALQLLDRYIIPKELLLDWLTSERYNAIERKSKPHVHALWKTYDCQSEY